MKTTNLINIDIHLKDLDEKIQALKRIYAANGMLGSGAYLKELCNLLLEDSANYATKNYQELLNRIKTEKLPQTTSSETFANMITKHLNHIFTEYNGRLEREASITCKEEAQKNRIIADLSFTENFNNKLTTLCSKFEADYAEYKSQKESESETLHIAKSSKRASWVFGIASNLIALGAFIVAYLAYVKN